MENSGGSLSGKFLEKCETFNLKNEWGNGAIVKLI